MEVYGELCCEADCVGDGEWLQQHIRKENVSNELEDHTERISSAKGNSLFCSFSRQLLKATMKFIQLLFSRDPPPRQISGDAVLYFFPLGRTIKHGFSNNSRMEPP